MNGSNSQRAGITLIEILIAVSLLSLLTVGMMMAMRIGFNTMEKVDDHLVRNRRVTNARKIVESEIAGFLFSRAMFQRQPGSFQLIPFMQWEAHSMRFVTAYSLQDGWRGRPQIAAFQVIPGERGEGVRLIVNETLWTGPAQTGELISSFDVQGSQFAPIVPGKDSFVLADRLSYCRFAYLTPLRESPFRVWSSAWELPSLPLGVRFEMAPLDATSTQLHVTTITALLSVNRDPGFNYADAQ